MPEAPELSTRQQRRLADAVAGRPELPYVVPFCTFLVLLTLNDVLPYSWRPLVLAIRGGGALYAAWLFRRHMPPLGRPHLVIAIVVGVLVAIGWVAGQHFLNTLHVGERSLGGRLFLFSGQPKTEDPRILYGPISAFSWWSQVVLRIAVSATAVPIVEELFWRGFMLRALIDWDHFNRVPLGKFTWFAFLGTSLLSILEHPDNWGVSILCWMVYNGLMFWKKSLLCLILTHGITNLVLYTYVVWAKDWLFW